MDFQAVVDNIAAMTCVVSVEKLDDGYGEIRIVTGNESYIKSIEEPAETSGTQPTSFVPNSPYTDYFPQDLNFENYCYNCAVNKECLHSYVRPDRIDAWCNVILLPLNASDGKLFYCTYSVEIDATPNLEILSDISGALASSILETSIKLHASRDFGATMDEVIKDIRTLCEAEYACILLMDHEDQTCSVLCEDIAEGSSLMSMKYHVAHNNFYTIAGRWKGTIAGSDCLIAKNEHDMNVIKKRNPGWYKSLQSVNATSVVLFPLKTRNGLLGYIWALSFNPDKALKIKETLEVTTYILSSEIANYHLLNRLRILSSHDMLTGVLNRNEMNIVVEELGNGTRGKGQTVGVIFADLNGLKEVNDAGGHPSGDMLLRNAASVLKEVFDENDIFRAGGDEFSIIITGITEKEILEKVEKIKEATKRYDNLFFAIGSCVEDDGSKVRTALRIADTRMYEDKRAFYEKNPKQRHLLPKDEFHYLLSDR